MAGQVKVLAAKPSTTHLIPAAHTVEASGLSAHAVARPVDCAFQSSYFTTSPLVQLRGMEMTMTLEDNQQPIPYQNE